MAEPVEPVGMQMDEPYSVEDAEMMKIMRKQ
jgi:hypothetical protein